MNESEGGFTLIELLVVVAIIALLASIILGPLRTARNKGIDGAIKLNLKNAMAQGEVFYNTNTAVPNSYTSVCDNPGPVGGADTVAALVTAAAKARGLAGYSIGGGGGNNIATCTVSGFGDAWKAEVPLTTAGKMWCVDSTGVSQQNNGSMGFWWACNF